MFQFPQFYTVSIPLCIQLPTQPQPSTVSTVLQFSSSVYFHHPTVSIFYLLNELIFFNFVGHYSKPLFSDGFCTEIQ